MDEGELVKALGPLGPLYQDPTVTDIVVDGPELVYVSRTGTLEAAGASFRDDRAVRAVIDDVLKLGGEELSPVQTTAEMGLPNAGRFVAVVPPTAKNGPCLVLHRPPTTPLSWDKLIEWGAVTPDARDLLAEAVAAGESVIVAGGLGSGKTTVACLVAELTPADQRVLVCEPAAEMRLRHPRAVHFEAGGPGRLPFAELLETVTLMRPDRMVVGELRGGEAMLALQRMATGCPGIGLVHATGVEDALSRLETMCLMAGAGLGLSQIRELVASAVGLVTYQRRFPDGHRRLTDVVALKGLTDGRYELDWRYRYEAAA